MNTRLSGEDSATANKTVDDIAMHAEERMRFHLAEFMKAAELYDSRIVDWKVWDQCSPAEAGPGAWLIVASREKLPDTLTIPTK